MSDMDDFEGVEAIDSGTTQNAVLYTLSFWNTFLKKYEKKRKLSSSIVQQWKRKKKLLIKTWNRQIVKTTESNFPLYPFLP